IPWKRPLPMVEREHVTTYSAEQASTNGRESACHGAVRDKSLSESLRESMSQRIPRKKPLLMVEREYVTTHSVMKASLNGRENACHDAFRDKSLSQWSRER